MWGKTITLLYSASNWHWLSWTEDVWVSLKREPCGPSNWEGGDFVCMECTKIGQEDHWGLLYIYCYSLNQGHPHKKMRNSLIITCIKIKEWFILQIQPKAFVPSNLGISSLNGVSWVWWRWSWYDCVNKGFECYLQAYVLLYASYPGNNICSFFHCLVLPRLILIQLHASLLSLVCKEISFIFIHSRSWTQSFSHNGTWSLWQWKDHFIGPRPNS